MNKELLTIALAFGCIAANATTNNYDLLGRKGSKMNTPMVYRNVDYSKVKKNEQKLNSSMENRSLAKTGMPDNALAIKGAMSTHDNYSGPTYEPRYSDHFISVYLANGKIEGCGGLFRCYGSWGPYENISKKWFIPVKYESDGYSGTGTEDVQTNVDPSVWRYSSTDEHQYDFFWNVVKNDLSKYKSLGAFYSHSDVGIFLQLEGLPVRLKDNVPVHYFKVNNTDVFNNYPSPEIEASRIYDLVNSGSLGSKIFFIGKSRPKNPADFTPQIYMGLRGATSKSRSGSYGSVAKELDNFIYQYRTLEFVPAGNFGPQNANGPRMNPMAYAANAVTVGAIDDYAANVVSSSTSTTDNVSSYTPYRGTQKPEIYNYSGFFGKGETKTYTRVSDNQPYTFQPYFEGTETAAAYTAGMVSNLLAAQPFYRWHPEVVKALLLTSEDGFSINPPYPTGVVTKTVPNYKYLVNVDKGYRYQPRFYDFDSRYWNGDINKLKTRTVNGKHEIWFIVGGTGYVQPKSAAIAWLSSGNDIYNNGGKVPQNFDLTVYGSDNDGYRCWANGPNVDLTKPVNCNGENVYFDFDHLGSPLASSAKKYNSFEKVNIPSTAQYKYYIFKIVLQDEYSASENKGQIVLGFNIAYGEYIPSI